MPPREGAGWVATWAAPLQPFFTPPTTPLQVTGLGCDICEEGVKLAFSLGCEGLAGALSALCGPFAEICEAAAEVRRTRVDAVGVAALPVERHQRTHAPPHAHPRAADRVQGVRGQVQRGLLGAEGVQRREDLLGPRQVLSARGVTVARHTACGAARVAATPGWLEVHPASSFSFLLLRQTPGQLRQFLLRSVAAQRRR